MKVYISGSITKNKNYKKQFGRAEFFLKMKGFNCFNPASLPDSPGRNWAEWMRIDLYQLLDCDSIYMLKNWRKSKGARLEHKLAKALGLTIIYGDI